MELLAAIRGLEALNSPKRVRLFSDSQYLVRGMSEWLSGWIRDGRLETPDALANQDLWQQLVPLSRTHQIDWQWVRGHAGHPFNERCDRLAKRAVTEGLRLTNQPEKTSVPEPQPQPQPQIAVSPEVPQTAPIEDYSEFGVEEDGQQRLC
jgi:ribonuclease HI